LWTNTPQEANTAISPNATQSHTEPHTDIQKFIIEPSVVDEILAEFISSPDIPLEEKTQAVFDAAGDALYQAGEYDPNENPIDYLKANAQRLTDTAERARVIAEIDKLARIYPPETNRYLAPNGKASNLNHAQWYAVRTANFKEWFGEWERAARIVQFEHSPNIALDGNAYKGKYELNKESILDYLENTLRKAPPCATQPLTRIFGWGKPVLTR